MRQWNYNLKLIFFFIISIHLRIFPHNSWRNSIFCSLCCIENRAYQLTHLISSVPEGWSRHFLHFR